MDWFVRSFLKGSLVWFSVAVLLAVTMAVVPTLAVHAKAARGLPTLPQADAH